MKRPVRSYDWWLWGITLALIISSVAMIYSLTAGRVSGNLALDQATFALVGIVSAVVVSRLDYRQIRTFGIPLFVVGLILLGLVLAIGTSVFGATRWITIAGILFQPSELMKLLLILASAHILTAQPEGELDWRNLGLLLVLVGVSVGLILAQPDLGTAAVLGSVTLAMLAGARLKRASWYALGGLIVVGVPILFFQLEDYQLARLTTFFAPAADPLGAGYNVLQSLIAVGNGGLFGQGVGQGTQSQLDFLPVVHTDFIFAGIAESVGFAGSLLLIVLFGCLIWRTISVARRAPDRLGLQLALGVASLWFVQFAINVGMNLALAPVTGIPLPFVSYGGTALIVNCLALGLVQAIATRSYRSSLTTS